MLIRGIKLALGALLGILIAYFLGLGSALTAGTVVLLSLGKTKRSSVHSAFVRVKGVTLALVLASVIFSLVGFTVYAFSFFLVIFICLILKLKLDEGLIIGAVLSSHLMNNGAIDGAILLNTVALFVIGVSVALLLNLYVPDMSEEIVKNQRYIEERFREILLMIATALRGDKNFDASILVEIETFIDDALLRAKVNDDNYLLTDRSYDVKYIRMRKLQLHLLKRMLELGSKIDMNLEQVDWVADLTEEFAHSLSESNSGEGLLARLEAVLAVARKEVLPKNRDEFENRAILFQYLNELRYFVELKQEFSSEYSKKV